MAWSIVFKRFHLEEACTDVAKNTGLFDYLGLCSSVGDVVTRLLTLTTYISHQFRHFIEDLVLRDISRFSEDFSFTSSRQHPRSSSQSICKSVFEECSLSSNSYIADSVLGRRASDIGKRLMVPLFGLQLAWTLALDSWRCCFYYIRCAQLQVHSQFAFVSIVSRVTKTLHGSSDDIGWLQHTSGMPPVVDGTARFLALLDSIRNGEHSLPNSFVYLLIPGLFSNHGPLYFVATKRFSSKKGLGCHIAKIHSEAWWNTMLGN